MKLKRIVFDEQGFRSLKKIDLDIAPRITVIAGHNGIGKSTILGLIANCSEYNDNK
ncbi:AAA family ATPase, partial [Acinetobacter baumannii]|nr:AAA family ATPase [Acinetobacter baumannii]